MPIRLCYTGNTFVNYPQSYQGRLRENTQMGAELIGVESIEADAEMLALVVDCLTTIGLREFQISVGNVDYFQSLIEDAGLGEESEARVRELIGNRNFPGVEEYLDSIEVRRSSREALVALEDLYGGEEVLDQAENIAPNSKAIMAVRRPVSYTHLDVYKRQQENHRRTSTCWWQRIWVWIRQDAWCLRMCRTEFLQGRTPVSYTHLERRK